MTALAACAATGCGGTPPTEVPDALEDVPAHCERFSTRARAGLVRNPAPELLGIALVDEDRAALAAFLRALNEDYE